MTAELVRHCNSSPNASGGVHIAWNRPDVTELCIHSVVIIVACEIITNCSPFDMRDPANIEIKKTLVLNMGRIMSCSALVAEGHLRKCERK